MIYKFSGFKNREWYGSMKEKSQQEEWQRVADIFRAVSHPVRIQILHELIKDTKCVLEVQHILDIPQPNLSHHLAILKQAGLVDSVSKGSLRCYFVRNSSFIDKIHAICIELIQAGNATQERRRENDPVSEDRNRDQET